MKNVPLTHVLLALTSVLALAAVRQDDGDDDEEAPRYLNLAGRTDERPFSHAVLADGTLYVAGTLGLNEAGEVPDSVEEEVRNVMDSIEAKLALADMTMDDLVSIQVFCPDTSLYTTFNEIYGSYFEKNYPARAFIGSGPLLFGARFEVNGIAYKD